MTQELAKRALQRIIRGQTVILYINETEKLHMIPDRQHFINTLAAASELCGFTTRYKDGELIQE